MARIDVEAQQDHVERLASRRTPIQAIGELIWNALDADATDVRVELVQNSLGGLEEIQVSDNGHGMAPAVATEAFAKLGASWKKGQLSPGGRRLHGQGGEGRFSAFALGGRVRWVSQYLEGGEVRRFEVRGRGDDLLSFDVGEPVVVPDRRTGVTVVVYGVTKIPRSLLDRDAVLRLARDFAIYLRSYPRVSIRVGGQLVDPSAVEDHVADYPISGVRSATGEPITAELTVIEWRHPVDRELVICDSAGFALDTKPVGIQAKGYQFTAYLRSDYFRACQERHTLGLGGMVPEVDVLVEAAKGELRGHFRRRSAESARELVATWKREEVYPYDGEPRDRVEIMERQVFDVLAFNINSYLPDFADSDTRSKKVSFRMIRAALERSPSELRSIFEHVLALPKNKREELVQLLERTSLTSIINASKLVVERLDFLAGLEVVLFDYDAKRKLKERQHLQHLIAENTWILGEQFHLTVDDQSLTEVLRRHLATLGSDRVDLAPVLTADDERGIVDLMISKRLPHPMAVEHLVVELKRPTVTIDGDVLNQLKKYAHAIARDARFHDTGARWNFWALSNEIHEQVRWELDGERNRPPGCALDQPGMRLWVKTWGQVIQEARGRVSFLQERLNLMADLDAGLSHLQTMYAKYLPPELGGEDDAAPPEVAATDAEGTPGNDGPDVASPPQDGGRVEANGVMAEATIDPPVVRPGEGSDDVADPGSSTSPATS